MKQLTPLTRVQMIEHSLRCFVLGLLGLLPALGLPFAVSAIATYARVSRRQSSEWNPAHRYLRWGLISGEVGLVITIVPPLVLLCCVLLSNWGLLN